MNASQQFKHYLDVAWRRKWWLLVPLVLSLAASQLVLKRLPKLYRASTTILITPQSLPEEFVRATVTQRAEDRMSSMTVQILSRSFLEQVARELGVIAKDSPEIAIESACNGLRARVQVDADKNLSYFEVTAIDGKPEHAARIANRLAELFIDQNTQMRSEQAAGTRETVEGWLEEKKNALDELEAQIAVFKRSHLWELSEQLESNLALLETGRNRVDSLDKDIQRRQERLTDLRATAKLEETLVIPKLNDPDPAARQLATLESELSQLLVSYTEENPVVRRKRTEIEEFRRRHPELAQPKSPPGEAVATSPRHAEIERLERDIAALQRDRDAAQAQLPLLTGRIDRTPLRDQELKNLTRGYDSLKKEYEDLMTKRDQAERAEELETTRKSEQFRVQDKARVPSFPFRPQPMLVLAMCVAVGLGLGAGAIVILEFLDQSMKSEDDFRHAFPDVPLLSAVPHVDPAELSAEARGRRRKAAGGRNAALLVLAGALVWELGRWTA